MGSAVGSRDWTGPGLEAAACGPPLGRQFYDREARVVARDLLGAIVCHRVGGRLARARIVETEAYVGTQDLASHSSHGRTPRTETMFGPPGHAYVYLIYGMYCMFNVVVSGLGDAQAVLVRAAEPLDGLGARLDGPGRLARGLGITLAQNGADLVTSDLRLLPGRRPERVEVTARIGVDYAGPWASEPLRFLDADSRWVSRGAGGRRRGQAVGRRGRGAGDGDRGNGA
jgi:DNA-3-methyladenine glycosylase